MMSSGSDPQFQKTFAADRCCEMLETLRQRSTHFSDQNQAFCSQVLIRRAKSSKAAFSKTGEWWRKCPRMRLDQFSFRELSASSALHINSSANESFMPLLQASGLRCVIDL